MRVERSIVVPADADAVYEVVANLNRRPQWLHELKRVETSDAQAKEGVRFVGESRVLGHDFLGTSEVVQANPGKALAEEVYLGARFTSEWTFTAVDGGTQVRHCIDIDFPAGPLGALARLLLRRRLASMQRSSLAALSRVHSASE